MDGESYSLTHSLTQHLYPAPIVPFPPLPVEIVRLIVEEAAHQSRNTAESLALSCLSFYCWLMPILFKAIVLRTSEQKNLNQIAHRIKKHRFQIPVAPHVKTIHLVGSVGIQDLAALNLIFRLCKNVQNTSLDPCVVSALNRWPAYLNVNAPFPRFRPRRLELNARSRCFNIWPRLSAPLFSAVTHLHLPLMVLPQATASILEKRMPCLTHLAVEHPVMDKVSRQRWMREVMNSCFSRILELHTLEQLVLWLPEARSCAVDLLPYETEQDSVSWSKITPSFFGRAYYPLYIDRRLIVCLGPLPGLRNGADAPRRYMEMPEALWEWANRTQLTQRLVLKRDPSPEPVISDFSKRLKFWALFIVVLSIIEVSTGILGMSM